MSPEVWLVCPFSRPHFLDNTLRNFWRQVYPYERLRLVLVCNGAAEGVTVPTSDSRITVLRSASGLSAPMNVGLAFARRFASSGAWFAKFDDDDFYGRRYLSQVARGLEVGADVVGKQAIWIRPKRGGLWFYSGPHSAWDPGIGVHGATITAKLEGAADFPEVRDWGEDAAWQLEARERGARVWIDEPSSYCYLRHDSGHAFDVSDDEIRSMGGDVFDCGEYATAVIEGLVAAPSRVRLAEVEIPMHERAAVRRALSRMPAELAAAYRAGGASAVLAALPPPT